MKHLTPKKIVAALDKYIIGQADAKRAIAVAVRNRWRRQMIPAELRDEVAPKNIIMIGSTGVGKTEIARRMAALVEAPFAKIEATRFTETGYVGRDCEGMIRDLVEVAYAMERVKQIREVEEKARTAAEERLVELILPMPEARPQADDEDSAADATARRERTREKICSMLDAGAFEDREVELDVTERGTPMVEIFSSAGVEQMGFEFQDMFDKLMPGKSKVRRVKVSEARQILAAEEADKLIDKEAIKADALSRAQESGVIFLDEIDKIAGSGATHGPDVSREGVQRDLLPIIEGTTVHTRYGVIKTDHILFIAAGAFNVSKPSDLVPEMQGRFPIRVELDDLTAEDFVRILTEPKNALIMQYTELIRTEGVVLEFTPSAIKEIASIAADINSRVLNIGARRLHTVMERLLNDVSFDAPTMRKKKLKIDAKYVSDQLADITEDEDLGKYIL